jgi:hypothetical protein
MSWFLDEKIMHNVNISNLNVEQVGIIFQDQRLPQSLGFGISVKDSNKEASIQRSHSICPTKEHFIDKYSSSRSLRYISSPSQSSHISGAKYERGRRLELVQQLRNSKSKVEKNQFHLNMMSASGDCRHDSYAIYIGAQDKVSANERKGKYIARNSKSEIKNWEEISELKLFNMDLNDLDKNRKDLKFKNFNSESLFNFENPQLSPTFIEIGNGFSRFPVQEIEEQPKKIRHNLGLPINSSISNNSSDGQNFSPFFPCGNSSESTIDLEGWFTKSSSKSSKNSKNKFIF